MKFFRWLCSIRSITILMTCTFVIVASLSTASVLWQSGEEAASKSGEAIVSSMITQVEQIVLSSLGDITELSIQGSKLAFNAAIENGNGTLSWNAIWMTSVFQLGTVKAFDLISSSGLLHPYNEWLQVHRAPVVDASNSSQYMLFLMSCEFCNATLYALDGNNYTEAFYPTRHILDTHFQLPMEWRNNQIIPTFSPVEGQDSMWGKTYWKDGVLERIFVTFVRINNQIIGIDYKGANMLTLQSFLNEVRNEGRIANEIIETRVFLLDENRMIISATHGGVGQPSTSVNFQPPNVTCEMSSDPVIKGSCSVLESDYKLNHHPTKSRTISISGNRYLFIIKKIMDPYGMRLTACMLLPRDIIFGDVEQGVRHSVFFVALIISLCAAVSTITAYVVSQPLVVLVQDLRYCLTMEVEYAPAKEKLSFLWELNKLETTYRQLVAKLKDYKTFMPQSIFIGENIDDVTSDDGVSQTTTSSVMSQLSYIREKPHIKGNVNLELERRTCTIIQCRVKGLYLCDVFNITAVHSVLMLTISSLCKIGGITFHGDIVTISLNTIHYVPSHAPRAISFCSLLENKLQGTLDNQDVIISVSSGKAYFGNIGTTTTRAFTNIGEPVEKSTKILNLLQHSECGSRVLCCDVTHKTCENQVLLLKVSSILSGVDLVCFSPDLHEANSGDWIYELQRHSEVIEQYNIIIASIEGGHSIENIDILHPMSERLIAALGEKILTRQQHHP